MTKRRAVHKSLPFIFAYILTYCTGRYIPDEFRSRTWDKVTCKNCLKQRPKINKGRRKRL